MSSAGGRAASRAVGRATARAAARPKGLDDLGLRRALGDRMLPLMVAAMTFLAALALAGSVGAASLARRWQDGAASVLTVQVPRPTAPAADGAAPRVERVLALLRGTPGIAGVRALDDAELAELLRPWLGSGAGRLSLPLPAVLDVRLAGAGPDLDALATRLEAVAPGTTPESHGVWVRRLAVLARSLQACAWAALALVAAVAVAVIAVATRSGLTARREAIEIVHGLGATDAYIAGRFSRRAMRLAALGSAGGALAALPVLLMLSQLAAPFTAGSAPAAAQAASMFDALPAWLAALPVPLWLALPGLPLTAGLIGLATAQATVRAWLRQLP